MNSVFNYPRDQIIAGQMYEVGDEFRDEGGGSLDGETKIMTHT